MPYTYFLRGATVQNRRPSKGTKIERVWAIADEQTKRTGRLAARKEVISQAVSEGIHPGTASTQHNAWKRQQDAVASSLPGKLGPMAIQIKEAGRIVLPFEMRAALGISEGDTLLASIEGRSLRLRTRDDAVRALQAKARKLVEPGTLVSEELIAERRRSSADE